MTNRIHKYRAWNKVQGKMFAVKGLDFTFNPPAILELNHDTEEIVVWDYWLNDGDFELMQYTGLNDKAGKPIFEGDIIQFEFNKTKQISVIHEHNHDGEGYCYWMSLPMGKREFEVIGNIYENPDLLKP